MNSIGFLYQNGTDCRHFLVKELGTRIGTVAPPDLLHACSLANPHSLLLLNWKIFWHSKLNALKPRQCSRCGIRKKSVRIPAGSLPNFSRRQLLNPCSSECGGNLASAIFDFQKRIIIASPLPDRTSPYSRAFEIHRLMLPDCIKFVHLRVSRLFNSKKFGRGDSSRVLLRRSDAILEEEEETLLFLLKGIARVR